MSILNNAYPVSGSQPKTQGEFGSWLALLFAGIQRLWSRQAEKRARAREMSELKRLTDRELWDLGLSRSDFLSIEQGTYRCD